MKKNADKKKNRVLRIFAWIAGGIVLLALLLVLIWNWYLDSAVNRFDEEQGTKSSEEISSELAQTDPVDPSFSGVVLEPDVTMPSVPAETIPVGENIVNILLAGQDRRAGQGRQRSDAIILCSINFEEKTMVMTSFMRDMWVNIPGYYDQRINVPYFIGGFDLLNETLKHNFGVQGDFNIEVDFAGFETVVNTMGGVNISLTAAEAAYLNRRGNWGVGGDENWSLVEGINHMDGTMALAYSRIRDIGNDFGRTQRQRTVLNALLEKAKKMDVFQLATMAHNLLPVLTTDMTNGDITNLLARIIPILPELEVISQRIPMDGYFEDATIQGNRVLYMNDYNLRKSRELLSETIGELEE